MGLERWIGGGGRLRSGLGGEHADRWGRSVERGFLGSDWLGLRGWSHADRGWGVPAL